MIFSIAQTTRRLLAPRHELSCGWWLWRRLWWALQSRGQERRESGAFLLGYEDTSGRRRIVDFVLYDDLDPNCLSTGIVRFDGRFFGQLWTLCRKRELSVVADVHTHPGSSAQSPSDQAHPMIARAGHLALIVPRYAVGPPSRAGLGMYRYRGAGRWKVLAAQSQAPQFYVGI